MTTLIAAYDNDGCVGRCDAKCYNATEPDCTCICGGMNHGAGRAKAMVNTSILCDVWMEKYGLEHPDVERFEVPALEPQQLSLFEIGQTE